MSRRGARRRPVGSARCAPRSPSAAAGSARDRRPSEPVALSVTRDFGATSLVQTPGAKVSGADTVMRVLRRNAKVTTRYGGEFVQSIDGLAGGRRAGRPNDWFIYVNGILADKGASAIDVHGGDRVWWDHHDWSVTPDVRAVVGSYPEPFVHGVDGKRLPVRVECVDPIAGVCTVVRQAHQARRPDRRAATSAAAPRTSRCGSSSGRGRSSRGRDAESDAIDRGPKASGVFARFDASGDDAGACSTRSGRAVRTLGAGSGPDRRDALEGPPAGVVRDGHRRRGRRRRGRARWTRARCPIASRSRSPTTCRWRSRRGRVDDRSRDCAAEGRLSDVLRAPRDARCMPRARRSRRPTRARW